MVNYKLFFLLFLVFCSFVPPRKKAIRVYLVGDSTISIKAVSAYPETGWGMPFATFFDSSIVIDNRAKNGRSTRTFLSEKLWQPVAAELQAGDYVFIQFGHNDESKEKGDRYATPAEYKQNLQRFIRETRAKGAFPVLLTPVSRRKFDTAGKAVETHAEYAPLVGEVAGAERVPLIDLNAKSKALYQAMGPAASTLLFLQLEKNEHPNYPEGKMDNTHFNELGARKIAQIVLQEVRALQLPLAQHIRKPIVK